MVRAGERPVAVADWDRALFVHFAIDPAVLQPHVPLPLDLHEGRAYVSLVAFTQAHVRPTFARALGPWGDRVAALGAAPVTAHPFLNLRTYVVHNGERGIYFLAEWIPSLLDRLLGPATYGLPYRLGRLTYIYDNSGRPVCGTVVARNKSFRFDVATDPDAEEAPAAEGLDRFLLEHYTAYTGVAGAVARRFRIWHAPWPQVPASVTLRDTGLLEAAAPWFPDCRLAGANFSPGVRDVEIGPPRRIGGRDPLLPAVVPALVLALPPTVALLTQAPAWAMMWSVAFAMFFACKWLTLQRATVLPLPSRERAGVRGKRESRLAVGYLLAWVGMDGEAFLDRARRPARPGARDWSEAIFKTAAGATLVWGVARLVPPAHPLAAAWVGMVGLVLLLHFGTFHLLALAWRRAGVDATPLMDAPSRSRSLSEFWSARWNRGFHRLAEALVFRPAVRKLRLRPAAALLATFVASGLVHDAVISLPARAGWGLPTLYFTIQGLAVLLERASAAKNRNVPFFKGLKNRNIPFLKGDIPIFRFVPGRTFTMAVTVVPLPLLFHAPFVRRVIVPFLDAIGAF